MAITISGSGITSANIADGTIVNADVADVAASKLTGALPAIDGSALTNLPASGLGVSQSWTDVSASRAYGTTYTNSTGKPIQVSISSHLDDGEVLEFRVGGVTMAGVYEYDGSPSWGNTSLIVPNGDTYACVNTTGTSLAPSYWSELR